MTPPAATPRRAPAPLGPDAPMVIVVPTYNEADNLEWIVGRVLRAQPAAHVLVVDDGSPDGTGDLADAMAAQDDRVQVVHRTEKAGLGAAYLHGFAVALERGYQVVGEMDADGSHQPEQLHRLREALEGADLVIGSRWVRGGSVVNWSLFRKALSVGGNLYARALLGVPVHDVTAGYRLFRAGTLRAIDLTSVESVGYCFQTDLTVRTLEAGLTVREVPIEFLERERGESKMSPDVATESLRRITSWGLERRGRQVRAALRGGSGARTLEGMRRRIPWWVLAGLFVGVPIVEIWLLIQLGQVVGPWWTILILVADGVLGAWLMKHEGARAWQRLNEALRSGRMPVRELADGALVLVGGTLLVTPGFITDAAGLFCVLPPTRPLARRC